MHQGNSGTMNATRRKKKIITLKQTKNYIGLMANLMHCVCNIDTTLLDYIKRQNAHIFKVIFLTVWMQDAGSRKVDGSALVQLL